ncbi:Na+/melibiose symporter-like transporter [Opitutaceae bacterium TAV1]|nr:Na+/melibiose symporter-like transporter [Opitutaceae bacterium TAV1]
MPPSTTVPVATPATSASSGKLRLRDLAAFGAGGVPYSLGIESLKNLANPIFNIVLGVNPAVIGAMHMIARLWDAFTDPVMGSISDNSRSRWGRRRPFIAVGALLSAIAFPLIWFVPAHSGTTAAAVWFLVTSLLFYTCFTLFSVPFFSLSLELSPDYHERTRVTAARSLFATLTSLIIAWAFKLAQLDLFPDTLTGMRWVGIGMGALFLIGGLPPALFLRERYQKIAQSRPKVPLFQSARVTFSSIPFRIILAVSVCMVIGINTFNALGIYVNTYYVFGGDTKQAAMFLGLTVSVSLPVAWISIPAITWLSGRIGKTGTIRICLCLGIIAGILKWFLFNPAHPYWQLALPLFLVPSSSGFWILLHSMKADICDEDELRTGNRREGMFGAVSGWVHKLAASLTFTLSGVVLVLTGFEQQLGGAQAPETILRLRVYFSLAPCFFFSACLVLFMFYRLGPREVTAIRQELETRRAAV